MERMDKRSHGRYLKYVRIQNKVIEKKDSIAVRCYYNGAYWICPNPFDKRRSTVLRDQYDQGYYIECKDLYLSEKEFQDPENWDN